MGRIGSAMVRFYKGPPPYEPRQRSRFTRGGVSSAGAKTRGKKYSRNKNREVEKKKRRKKSVRGTAIHYRRTSTSNYCLFLLLYILFGFLYVAPLHFSLYSIHGMYRYTGRISSLPAQWPGVVCWKNGMCRRRCVNFDQVSVVFHPPQNLCVRPIPPRPWLGNGTRVIYRRHNSSLFVFACSNSRSRRLWGVPAVAANHSKYAFIKITSRWLFMSFSDVTFNQTSITPRRHNSLHTSTPWCVKSYMDSHILSKLLKKRRSLLNSGYMLVWLFFVFFLFSGKSLLVLLCSFLPDGNP